MLLLQSLQNYIYLYIAICNRTTQIANKSEILIILLLSFELCSKFNTQADNMYACHSIAKKMNNYNQYLIITNMIIINTIIYVIQTLFVIESQIISKISLLGNVWGTTQIRVLTMNFHSFKMAAVSHDAIIVGRLVEQIAGVIVIELYNSMVLILMDTI